MYCYIKDRNLIMTSSHFIQKKQEEVLTKVNKTRIVENIILDEDGKEISEEEYSEIVIAHPFVDGMVYDEVIETKLSGRLAYEKEKIISWEKSQEKKEEVKRLQDQHQKETKEYLKNRPSEIRELL